MASKQLNASALVNADGTTVRKDGVQQVYREGAGIYHLIWPASRNLRAAEHHFDLTVVDTAAARIIQAGNLGDAAPPGGANAEAGALSLKVLTFDATGVAADAKFSFAAEKV